MVLPLVLLSMTGQASQKPADLTWETFSQVKHHASPRAEDLAWQQIDWQNTVADGVNKARLEDKPIVMWLYFGDPRGSC